MRHELEERRSKALIREEEGNARKGNLRIDLDSGVAVIAVSPKAPSSTAATPSPDGEPSPDRAETSTSGDSEAAVDWDESDAQTSVSGH